MLGLLGVVLLTGTMSLAQYPELQSGIPILGNTLAEYGVPDLGLGWFVFTPVGLVGFILFFISVLAEGERTPFDIPEADSEIVVGHMTEYSGMKFAVFYLGQFVLNYALSMVAAIAFLGGWQGPGVGLLVATGNGFLIFLGGALSVLYLLIEGLVPVLCDDLAARRLPALARRSADGLCLEVPAAAGAGQYPEHRALGGDYAVGLRSKMDGTPDYF